MTFLSGTEVCAQATPLIAFLSGKKLGPTENTHCKPCAKALGNNFVDKVTQAI